MIPVQPELPAPVDVEPFVQAQPGVETPPPQFQGFEPVPTFESQRIPTRLPILQAVPTGLPILEAVPTGLPTQPPFDPFPATVPVSAAPLIAPETPAPLLDVQELVGDVDPGNFLDAADDVQPSNPVIVSTPTQPLQAFPAVPI